MAASYGVIRSCVCVPRSVLGGWVASCAEMHVGEAWCVTVVGLGFAAKTFFF